MSILHAMRLTRSVKDYAVWSNLTVKRFNGSAESENCHIVGIAVKRIAGAWLKRAYMTAQFAQVKRGRIENYTVNNLAG